jgi:hypothetical protein
MFSSGHTLMEKKINLDLVIEQKVDSLLAQMTLDEKIDSGTAL